MYRTKINLNTNYSFIIKDLDLKFTVPTYWINGGSEFLNDPYFKNLLNNIGEEELVLVDVSEDPLNFSVQNTLIKDKRFIIITANPLYFYEFAAQSSLLKKICPYKTIFFNKLFRHTKANYYLKRNVNYINLKKKRFLLMSRRDTFYRRLTNYFVHKFNLFEHGYVSHNRIDEQQSNVDYYLELHKDILGDYDDCHEYSLKRHYLDNPASKENATIDFNAYVNYLNHVQFEIVTETVMYSSCMFISEKALKPIIYKKPFMLIGSVNSLKYIQKLGFKTFHPIINEDYDSENNNVLRLEKLLREAKRLCSKSYEELEKDFLSIQDIIEHNYNHFISKDWHFNIQTKVQKYINENITNR